MVSCGTRSQGALWDCLQKRCATAAVLALETSGIVLSHQAINCLLGTQLDQVLYSSLTMLGNAQENVNGCLEIFVYPSVDKNVSRKFFKYFSLYNNVILI